MFSRLFASGSGLIHLQIWRKTGDELYSFVGQNIVPMNDGYQVNTCIYIVQTS